MYSFAPHKSFGQLLYISTKNLLLLKTFDSEFSFMEVWITDQNPNPLEIQDKINITFVINQIVKYKEMGRYSSYTRDRIYERLLIFVFC